MKKKNVWYVAHLIHVRTPYQHIPKLFITDVPDGVEITWSLVDCYKEYGEFGIPHANHYIEKLTNDSPPEIKRAWRNGECEFITYDELLKYADVESDLKEKE
ncbi:MAG: hypothetical protein QXX03_05525 [Nitrososphaerota archaeon]